MAPHGDLNSSREPELPVMRKLGGTVSSHTTLTEHQMVAHVLWAILGATWGPWF